MAYDAIEITKLFVFGTNSPSPTDYNLHIRPATATPASITYNMGAYMTSGGGRYAYASLFGAINKFFNAPTLADGVYSYAQMSALLGFSAADTRLNISQYGTGIGSADHAERSYIFGNTPFELGTGMTFEVKNGVRTIKNMEVRALQDNFDFQSRPGSFSQLLNSVLLEPTFDPYALGRGEVTINYSGSGKIYTSYDQLDFNTQKSLEGDVNGSLALGIANLALSGGTSYFSSIAADPFLSYKRGDLKVIYGTPGSDSLTTSSAELSLDVYFGYLMAGGEGHDNLSGGLFADELDGGEGNDVLDGSGGADTLKGGAGDDTLSGGYFADEMYGGAGNDVLNGDTADDTLHGDDDNDSLSGGEGADKLYGDKGNDTLKGGSEGDLLSGGEGLDSLYGDDGADTLYGEENKDQLFGGAGDDSLDGSTNNDTLNGEAGSDTLMGGAANDTLDGGAGGDRLQGGMGYDKYLADQHDTISDLDGSGSVSLNQTVLTGGSRKKSDPPNIYKSKGGQYTYVLQGTTLVVNGGLTIENFVSGRLGITLRTEDDKDKKPDIKKPQQITSPIVLDLDGDGVETTALGAAYFDFDANGLKEEAGWVSSDDGILVRDLNGDGVISDGRELFGNHTLLQNGQAAANGFQALAEQDDNGDGLIDAQDAAFSTLKVWQDADGNGYSDAGEFKTLTQAGVLSISTGYSVSNHIDDQGNEHRQIANMTLADGTVSTAEDIWFVIDASERVDSGGIDLTDEVLALPNARGFGKVYDLQQAMVLDPGLKDTLAHYLAATDATVRSGLLDTLIYRWTGSASIDPNSRDPKKVYGHVMDARQLVTLENLVGASYLGIWCWGEYDPNPHGQAAPVLIAEYLKFKKFTEAQILVQTEYAPELAAILPYFGSYAEGIVADWSTLENTLTTLYTAGQLERLKGLIGVLSDLGTYSPTYQEEKAIATQGIAVSNVNLAPFFDFSLRVGTVRSDTLFSSGAGAIFQGLEGDDRLYGSTGSDSYYFARGHGADTILDSGGFDQIAFGGDITANNLSFSRDVTTVWIQIQNADGSSAGSLRLDNFFNFDGALHYGAIEKIKFSDGSSLEQQQILEVLTAISITPGHDLIFASPFGDTVAGLTGNDSIYGLSGNDRLSGDEGQDQLSGDDGDDTLDGGAGDDVLIGGRGSDSYVFAAGHGRDVINNYGNTPRVSATHIRFGGSITQAQVSVQRQGDDLLIHSSATDSVRVSSYFYAEATTRYAVDQIDFADGSSWSIDDVKNRVTLASDGDDAISGYASHDALSGLGGSDTLLGHAGDDTLSGGDDSDDLDGGVGHDVAFGDAGDDRLAGGEGHDELDGGSGNDDLVGNNDQDLLRGGAGDDTLSGDAGRDTLWGGAGHDVVDGGIGDDVLAGGTGQDSLFGGRGTNSYIFARGDGNDRISDAYEGTVTIYLADLPLDELVFRREGFNLQVGFLSSADDRLTLADFFGGEIPRGGIRVGYDNGTQMLISPQQLLLLTLDGTAGRDIIYAYSSDDFIAALDGDDEVHAGAGHDTLLGGAGHDSLDAGDGDDQVDGGAGNDRLDGGGGADTLVGGLGDDVYVVDDVNDQVQEAAGQGDDTVRSSVSLSLLNDFESLVLTGQANINGSGNDAANVLLGNVGDNQLSGGAGDDDLDGQQGADTLSGGIGNDVYHVDQSTDQAIEMAGEGDDMVRSTSSYTLSEHIETLVLESSGGYIDGTGSAQANHLIGNDYSNVLDGGLGNDTLEGGDGDDTYVVDTLADHIIEAATGGFDTVQTELSYTLADVLEAITLTGQTDAWATGHAGDNILRGNDGHNRLDGGAGSDDMAGGAGNDTYMADEQDSRVYEEADQGIDTVVRDFNSHYYLEDHVENLSLLGEVPDGYGNTLDNVITGNAAANTLVGFEGNDTLIGGGGDDYLIADSGDDSMAGGAGNDYYEVDSAADAVIELSGEGSDYIHSTVSWTLGDHVENLELIDSEAGGQDLSATGNALSNGLWGTSGQNVLTGGQGNDYQMGRGGDDVYVFNKGDGQDTLDNVDLVGAIDTLRLTMADTDVMGMKWNNSLIFKIRNSTDQIYVSNYYAAPTVIDGQVYDQKIDRVEFSNGVVWDQAMIQTVVDRATNNRAPTVSGSIPALSAKQGSFFSYVVPVNTITDPDPWDSVSYGARMIDGTPLPAWLSFDPLTRTLSGTPGAANVGRLQFLLWGTDLYGYSTGLYVNLTVGAPNKAPVLATALPDQTAAEGAAFSYTVAATAFTDPDAGDTLSYSATLADGSALPAWLSFNAATRAFSGTPPSGTAGKISVRVTAKDPGNLTAFDVFDLTINVPNLRLTGTANADTLSGGAGHDTVTGAAGNDVLNGLAGNDSLDGGAGNDNLQGGLGNDTLLGGTESDTLDGGAGNDSLNGGAGNDVYYIDSAQDVIAAEAGTAATEVDAVFSSVTWTLGTNIENLTLTGSGVINGIGNAAKNVLTGNDANNTLSGLAGDDSYEGRGGNDALVDNSTTSNDSYTWGRGMGVDTVTDAGGTADLLKILAGAASNQIWLSRSGSSLQVAVIGTADRLLISNWYTSATATTLGAGKLETLRTTDGNKSLTSAKVQALVAAMASFSPSVPTTTTLPANAPASLTNLIATSWV